MLRGTALAPKLAFVCKVVAEPLRFARRRADPIAHEWS
jgi:hypothetical protein